MSSDFRTISQANSTDPEPIYEEIGDVQYSYYNQTSPNRPNDYDDLGMNVNIQINNQTWLERTAKHIGKFRCYCLTVFIIGSAFISIIIVIFTVLAQEASIVTKTNATSIAPTSQTTTTRIIANTEQSTILKIETSTTSTAKSVSSCDYYSGLIELYEFNKTSIKNLTNLHTDGIKFLKFLTNGYVASSSWDKTVNIWDPIASKSIRKYPGHVDTVYSLDQIDSDTMVSGSFDKTIQIWKISIGANVRIITLNKSVIAIKVLLNGNQIACGLYDTSDNLRLYNYSTGDLIGVLKGHSEPVNSIEILSEQFIVSAGGDFKLIVWDLNAHTIMYKLGGHVGWINCVKNLLFDSNKIASADDTGLIIIWDWLRGSRVLTLTGHTNLLYYSSLDLYDEQTLISGSLDRTIKFWNITNGQLIQTLQTNIKIGALARTFFI